MKAFVQPAPLTPQLATLPAADPALVASISKPPLPPAINGPKTQPDTRRNKSLSSFHRVNRGLPITCKECGESTTDYNPSRYTRCRTCDRKRLNRATKENRKKKKAKRERAKREAERKRQERARVKAVQARLMEIDPGSALEEFRDALAFQFPDPDFFARQIVDLVNDSGSKRARFRAVCLIARLIDETGGVERYRDAAGTMAEKYG